MKRWGSLFVAIALLLPASLVQAGRAEEDRTPQHLTWEVEGVFARGGGGLDKEDVDYLASEGFGAIANFRHEHQDPEEYIREKGMNFLYIPIEHTADINLTQVKTFVAWAKEQEAEGRAVYAHCTLGWHRATVFTAAYLMEREGVDFDDVVERLERERPGTVMRTPSTLLQYQAELRDEPGLVMLFLSPKTRPEKGGTMPVTVEVLAGGKPAEGAEVKIWSEEGGMDLEGVTDENGLFNFTYEAPSDHSMDHLYGRASLPGYGDGADQIQMFYFSRVKERGPLDVDANLTPEGIHVQVSAEGDRKPSRILATTQSGWMAFESSVHGEVMLPPPPPGEDVFVRAETWGSEGGSTVIDVEPLPEPELEPEPGQAVSYSPPEEGVPGPGAALALAMLVAAAALPARRRARGR